VRRGVFASGDFRRQRRLKKTEKEKIKMELKKRKETKSK